MEAEQVYQLNGYRSSLRGEKGSNSAEAPQRKTQKRFEKDTQK